MPKKKRKKRPKSKKELTRSAKKGWETRRKNRVETERIVVEGVARSAIRMANAGIGVKNEFGFTDNDLPDFSKWTTIVPGFHGPRGKLQDGFDKMTVLLYKWGRDQDPQNYVDFREMKRLLFSTLQNPVLAAKIIKESALRAGWEEELALRFSKLS